MSFLDGLGSALWSVVITELGDKSFVLAVVLSARLCKKVVFAAVYLALVFMSILSAVIGSSVFRCSGFISEPQLKQLAGAVFLGFGIHTFWKRETSELSDQEIENGKSEQAKTQNLALFAKIFLMACLAEMGDRSQVTAILLGASKNLPGFVAGALTGHAICTGLAVFGGKSIAGKIPLQYASIGPGLLYTFLGLSFLFG